MPVLALVALVEALDDLGESDGPAKPRSRAPRTVAASTASDQFWPG